MMGPDNSTPTDASSSSVTETVGTKDYLDGQGRRVILKTHPCRFVCCICYKVFCKKTPCVQHLAVTHKIEVNEIKRELAKESSSNNCRQCGKYFQFRSNMYRHVRAAHGAKDIPNRTEKVGDVNCPICNQTFVSVSGVNRHIQTVHSYDLESESNMLPADLIPCHFCNMKFSSESKCRNHMSIFHHVLYKSPSVEDDLQMEPYQCTLCETHFTCRSEVKEHLLYKHGKDLNEFHVEVTSVIEDQTKAVKDFNCNDCKTAFKDEILWRSHMKDQHKAFPDSCCPECGDHSFNTVSELKCHLECVHAITVPKETSKRKLPRAAAENLGLSVEELRALEKIPDWLVKHSGGQLLLVLERTA